MPSARRRFLTQALAGSAALGGAAFYWQRLTTASAAPAVAGPYGPPGPPDANGVRLPPGFRARLLGQSGVRVAGTDYEWHLAPDGGACFAAPDGGWVYVANCEREAPTGGAAAIRFAADGLVVAAYRILAGTRRNCAGGATPWGSWLSCEEMPDGQVWECDPLAPGQGVVRPALGSFSHEAAAVDPASGVVYLTEDDMEGRLYRFRPSTPGHLAEGTLESACVAADGRVRWVAAAVDQPCRLSASTAFRRGEGAWFAGDLLYFSTTADHRIWAYDPRAERLAVLYDGEQAEAAGALHWPDNLTVQPGTADLFVGEDDDDLQLVLLADAGGRRIAAPFMQLEGHAGSEVAGPAFSPDGTRLYVSSQRGRGGRYDDAGMTFEITGPWRRLQAPG